MSTARTANTARPHRDVRAFVVARTVVVVVGALACMVVTVAGCGQQQSAVCKTFIACEQAYAKASDTAPIDLSQYEADGVCWQSGDNAQKCDAQCTEGTAAVRQAAADANLTVPACK